MLSKLQQTVQPYKNYRLDKWDQIIRSNNFKKIYPLLLCHTFHYVKYSVPLLRAYSRIEGIDAGVKKYYISHAEEEQGHEEWILDDLANLGYPRDLARKTVPLSCIVSLVGTQLYLIEEARWASLLSYMYVLESDPVSVATVKYLSENFDIPMSALQTFLRHGEDDIEHSKRLSEVVDSTYFDSNESEYLIYSGVSTEKCLCEFVDNLESILV